MNWSLKLLLTITLAQILLYITFKKTRRLPIIRNVIFERLAIAMIGFSLILVYFSNRGNIILGGGKRNSFTTLILITIIGSYAYAMIIVNIMYYMGLWDGDKIRKKLFICPVIIIEGLIISSPYNGLIFKRCQEEIIRGNLHNIIYAMLAWHFALFLYYFYRNKVEIKGKNIYFVAACFILTWFAFIVNYMTKSIIVIDFFLCASEYIIYLKMCDPKSLRSCATNMFNRDALKLVIDEFYKKNKDLYMCGIKFSNYQSVMARTGMFRLDNTYELVSEWIRDIYKDAHIFDIGTQSIIITSESPLDLDDFKIKVKKRFSKSFSVDDFEIILWADPFSVDGDLEYYSGKQFIDNIDYIVEHSDLNSEKIFIIDSDKIAEIKRLERLNKIMSNKIKEKDFLVYYQPLYCAKDKKIRGAEALVRMYDDEFGLIMPNDFVPLAEITGEILGLGLVVFEQVCSYIKRSKISELGIKSVSVNVSPLQFQERKLVDKYKAIADKYQVDLSFIEFEITESVMLKEHLVEYQINEFKKYNAKLAIDDFGMGSSNLQRLVKYPFSAAKLDLQFVWSYFKGQDNILEHVIKIFKDENLEIVAEGVEEENMVQELEDLGCGYLQGYYFSKPINEEEFYKYVEEFNK